MRLIVLCIACFILSIGSVSAVSNRVDNFRLLDQHHSSHELYYHKDAKAVVLMVTIRS
jgi:hypothetical protein